MKWQGRNADDIPDSEEEVHLHLPRLDFHFQLLSYPPSRLVEETLRLEG